MNHKSNDKLWNEFLGLCSLQELTTPTYVGGGTFVSVIVPSLDLNKTEYEYTKIEK